MGYFVLSLIRELLSWFCITSFTESPIAKLRNPLKSRDHLKWSGLLATTPFLKYTLVWAEESQRILEFELTAKESVQSLAGPEYPDTLLWLYNDRLVGPFLKAQQGDLLQVRFRNQLPVPSTFHWHGPTRCTGMDITFGLSKKESFCHKKGILIWWMQVSRLVSFSWQTTLGCGSSIATCWSTMFRAWVVFFE